MKIAIVAALSCVLLVVALGGVEAQGPTDDCPKACPFNYQPVCGRDSSGNTRTFSNECDFKMNRCNEPAKNYQIIKQVAC